ncbi:MAG: phospholipase D family protein [Methanocorpusculum sp.]|nr:phospholipase D family protein [Methanocorpusculum sp.]MDD3271444.1 phospholipase D family protein [Syntrophomonadaceae bacterium]
MLEPNQRNLYMDEFCPPAGYQTDMAIGTTFSLDLLSLLMAPVNMMKMAYAGQEQLLKDPIVVLEALKNTANKLAVFCQQGRIAVPGVDSRLYSYLESSVVEVQPRSSKGVFHPKVWVLRFTADNEPVLYRVVCLSRNLTFDRSWDTMLTLEGELDGSRINAFSRNRPLADFIASLPTLAVRPVNERIQQHIDLLADEVLRARFVAPQGFNEEFSFIPLGIRGYKLSPAFDRHSRLMIMSPFISPEQLQPLQQGSDNLLITRAESLDALSDQDYEKLLHGVEVMVLEDTGSQTREEMADDQAVVNNQQDLFTGLHAKLYISEEGWDARLLTGSINATNAAMSGSNVEFAVELTGRRSTIGINKMLGDDSGKECFFSLLVPYQRKTEVIDEAESIRLRLEMELETARQKVTASGLSLTVEEGENNTFKLLLGADNWNLDSSMIKAACYPLSLKPAMARNMGPLLHGEQITFAGLSLVGITVFLVVELEASAEETKSALSMVLNLPVANMPEERDQAIVRSLISNRSAFIRYLMLLLADTEETGWLIGGEGKSAENGAVGNAGPSFTPLLETMVKALTRNPEKIDNIDRLVQEIMADPEGGEVLPEGFVDIWGAFMKIRKGERE